MTVYVLRRLAYVVVIMAIMSGLVFLSTQALPENTAQVILGDYATLETQAALEAKLGLNRPLGVRYVEWAGGLLHGDFGRSLILDQPIAPILSAALAKSAIIAVAAMIMISIVGIALGVAAAVNYRRPFDHIVSALTYIGLSVPEFFWGLILILVFGSYFRWFPTSGYSEPGDGIGAFLAHLALPVITLTIGLQAHVSRLTRSSMLEALDSNYVRAARARGMPERVVVFRHALRNAMLPTITVLAQDLGFLIGGIVAVETIFAYPGVGRLLVYSLSRHDLPLIQAAVLVITAVYCLANLAADLLYGAFNPRIRYGRAVD
jgi:peptide/nickel transport system permease protein